MSRAVVGGGTGGEGCRLGAPRARTRPPAIDRNLALASRALAPRPRVAVLVDPEGRAHAKRPPRLFGIRRMYSIRDLAGHARMPPHGGAEPVLPEGASLFDLTARV